MGDQKYQKVDDYSYYTEKLSKEDKLSKSLDFVNTFYDLATEFYIYGWGQCFHFFNSYQDDTFDQAASRHQHYMANLLQLNEADKVLDVGCGVGGPLREMIKFSNCHVTGINNNEMQLEKASAMSARLNLSDRCKFVKGDFMNMHPIKDNTFDKVYSIEATVHASDLLKVYQEINRVVKPNGLVCIYEWCMTDKYVPGNKEHERLKLAIEKGNGIADLRSTKYAKQCFEKAGFEIIKERQLDAEHRGLKWHKTLEGRYTDGIKGIMRTRGLRRASQLIAYMSELVGVAPKGASKFANDLYSAQDNLIEASKEEIFTPMYLLFGRKKQSNQN